MAVGIPGTVVNEPGLVHRLTIGGFGPQFTWTGIVHFLHTGWIAAYINQLNAARMLLDWHCLVRRVVDRRAYHNR